MFTIEFQRTGLQWSATLSELTVGADATLCRPVTWGEGASAREAIREMVGSPRTEGVLDGVGVDDLYLMAITGGAVISLKGGKWLRVEGVQS